MLKDQRMSDVYPSFACQSLRCAAPSVECKFPCTPTQKSNAAAVPDANKKVQIQGECLGIGNDPATPSVLIAEFNVIWSVTDDLAQFLTVKQHVAWGLRWYLLSR